MRSPWLPAIALALCLSNPATARTLGTLEFKPCDLPAIGQSERLQAECATLEVAENPDEPGGRKISLRIGLAPSTSPKPEPDPIFYLAGGPGQSALESYPGIANGFRRIRAHRHVILMDQRGTGGSHKLDCKLAPASADGNAAPPATLSDDPGAFQALLKDCLATLDADPRHYTTEDGVRDMEAIRVAIGAERINLYGGSYGSRIGQHYLKRHPERTRSVILDGVVPPELALGEDHATNLQGALDAISARCSSDAACAKAFGDMSATLAALREQVVREPREVSILDPQTGEPVRRRFDLEALVTVARLFAYSPETAALLPLSLEQAKAGRPEALLAQAMLIGKGLGEQITHGMELSVICAEDADLVQDLPANAGTLLGGDFVKLIRAACAVWPRGKRAEDFHAPIKSDVPVLLLSGEFDPVTPPRYGEQAKPGLSRSRHLVAKGQGHIVLTRGCMPRIAGKFLDDPDPAKLDIGCMDDFGPTPLFVTPNGWEP